jgi:HTH-type transcriptional regulator, competence development regulator
MMKETKDTGFPGAEWLRRMADAEDQCESISVGGLAQELGVMPTAVPETPKVFGRFIEFARRERGLTVEALAQTANVDLAELVAIETECLDVPTPRTVYQLAQVLALPPGRLSEIAGLTQLRSTLSEAAVRFAARSEPTAKLTEVERQAFEELVKVLVESTD